MYVAIDCSKNKNWRTGLSPEPDVDLDCFQLSTTQTDGRYSAVPLGGANLTAIIRKVDPAPAGKTLGWLSWWFYLGLLLKNMQKLQLVQNIAPQAVLVAHKVGFIVNFTAAGLHLGPIQGVHYHIWSPAWHGSRLSEKPVHPSGISPPHQP